MAALRINARLFSTTFLLIFAAAVELCAATSLRVDSGAQPAQITANQLYSSVPRHLGRHWPQCNVDRRQYKWNDELRLSSPPALVASEASGGGRILAKRPAGCRFELQGTRNAVEGENSGLPLLLRMSTGHPDTWLRSAIALWPTSHCRLVLVPARSNATAADAIIVSPGEMSAAMASEDMRLLLLGRLCNATLRLFVGLRRAFSACDGLRLGPLVSIESEMEVFVQDSRFAQLLPGYTQCSNSTLFMAFTAGTEDGIDIDIFIAPAANSCRRLCVVGSDCFVEDGDRHRIHRTYNVELMYERITSGSCDPSAFSGFVIFHSKPSTIFFYTA